MDDEYQTVEPTAFGDMELPQQLLIVGGGVLIIVLYAAMLYVFWRWIKANIQLPKEVSRAADALERIAISLEKKK